MEATRQIYWNTQGQETIYILALLSFLFFLTGMIKRIKCWRMGRSITYNNLGLRVRTLLGTILKHPNEVFKGTYRRFMHMAIFYGFIILALGSLIIALQEDLHIPVFKGASYLLMSLLMDLFGLAVMIGILMSAYKRYIDKRDHEEYTLDDGVSLLLIFAIIFTGFLLEGLRIYVTEDPWAAWSPVGLLIAVSYRMLEVSKATAQGIHTSLWYIHMLLSFGFIGYIPYSKLFHLISTPLNLLLHTSSHIGELSPVDRLNLTSDCNGEVGVTKISDFTQKQLLELDACVSCLRCVKGCPVNLSGAPLSPRGINKDLKDFVRGNSSLVFNTKPLAEQTIVEHIISQDTLWACTTCGLCEAKCPVKIEHIRKIVDMRRGLVSRKRDNQTFAIPMELERLFNNLCKANNPWGSPLLDRHDLSGEVRPPLISQKKQVDVLYWVGCFGSYDERNRKVSQALFKILDQAKLNYAVLGEEEKCCGDSVRRLGNEGLFQELATENINTLNQYSFKTIVTHCPHCFNMLKNEYPEFGGHYHVLHHSELIRELLNSGKLKLKSLDKVKVSYHDPCYLGRYNSIYDAPRDLLNSVPGAQLVEMKNNRIMASCCGGGGGRIWMKDLAKRKLNIELVEKAIKNEAAILASACPLCLTRLNEATAGKEADIDILDIAELIERTLA